MLKKIARFLLIFFLIVFLGFCLMVFTYLLPHERVKRNVFHSDVSFLRDEIIEGDRTTFLDNYTDSIILGELAYEKTNVGLLKNAMGVYGVGGGVDNFHKFVLGKDVSIKHYRRYWHGNLVVFKPLFMFLNYQDVKMVMLFLECVLLFIVVKLMLKNNLKKYVFPFLVSLFFIHPEVMGISLQYCSIYNLLLVSLIILLLFKDKFLKSKWFSFYFFIIGMATSFFDFLTYPAVTFGILIVFYYLVDDQEKSTKRKFLNILIYGILWSIGYFSMWFSKWVIASIVFHEDCITKAIDMILFRSSTTEFSRLDAIFANLGVYNHCSYLIIFISLILFYLIRLYKYRNNIQKKKLMSSIPILLVSIIPFTWYFVISNHSYIHYWMTYRELCILFFALQCFFEYNIDNRVRSHNEKRSRKSK